MQSYDTRCKRKEKEKKGDNNEKKKERRKTRCTLKNHTMFYCYFLYIIVAMYNKYNQSFNITRPHSNLFLHEKMA